MTTYPVTTGILLGVAVGICFLCALAMLVMKDAYQRLNFPTSVVSLSALLIAVAIFIEDGDAGTRIKTVIIMVMLFVLNGVLSHYTARAIRIRDVGRWPVKKEEGIPMHGEGRKVGEPAGKAGEGAA